MQAALTASERGHEVVLFEKSEKLGGNLVLASGLAIKGDMKRYLAWLVRQTGKAPGVTVKLNTEATAQIVKAEHPDVIILALGADPLIPDIPGIPGPHVVWAGDVDTGKVKVGDTVVVAGGGSTGGETALQLAMDGKKVTMIDMLSYAAVIAGWPRGLADLLEQYGVRFLTEVKLEGVTGTGALVIDNTWKRFEIPPTRLFCRLGSRLAWRTSLYSRIWRPTCIRSVTV